MSADALFVDVEDDTRAAILSATFTALCEHGYADLTIQRIGDEFEMSKSLLYHHYQGKDELLLEFLEYLLSTFQRETPFEDVSDPETRLSAILDHLLPVDPPPEKRAFMQAMIELRAQAAHDPEFRAHFTRTDALLRERFETILNDGIERGVFQPHEVERVASMFVTLLTGSMIERVSTDETAIGALRKTIDSYVENDLRADGST